MRLCGLANRLWSGANHFRWRRFVRALDDPGAAQRELLRHYLRGNARTSFGRDHGFAAIDSTREYQRRVPLSSWDADYRSRVERIRRGEAAVLTREPVRRLIPSSGSTAACKWIPCTDSLQSEFQRGIGPWIVDLYRSLPALRDGRAYWSISPAGDPGDGPDGEAIPVGFEEDSAYVGGRLKRLVDSTLVVPPSVRRLRDLSSFRYVTLLQLLRASDLRLISVWHPSFLTLLLEPLEECWERLLDDVETGGVTPPRSIDASTRAELLSRSRPDRRRARSLREVGPDDLRRVWPRLTLISCWGDAQAASAQAALQERFPSVPMQRKGLLATEAFVSLPFRGAWPAAVRSHFFEFLDERGHAQLLDELRDGAEYSVVLTTGGGLYRYRLGDRVRVEGFLGRTPSLRFLAREDRVSDHFGEKLSEGHAAAALREVLDRTGADISFAMLAPDRRADDRLGYTLYVESELPLPAQLARRLDEALSTNPNYRYCVELGQLAPLRVFRIARRAQHAYLERCERLGQSLGDVKPAALSRETGWSECFEGDYS